jgi:NAD(P)-dependent dehydrogenase (short-subunit alcohol dehydrogenase family)
MDLGLKNKNALIMGGSQGIGFAIAKALAEKVAMWPLAPADASVSIRPWPN